MSIEDDAIAILGLVRQQQAAIDAAAAALAKASTTLSADHGWMVKTIEQMQAMPAKVAEASKTGAEEGAAVGVKNSLTTESEELGVAVKAATTRFSKLRKATLWERAGYSLGGGLVGASLMLAVFVAFIKFDMLIVRVENVLDPQKVANLIVEKLPKKR